MPNKSIAILFADFLIEAGKQGSSLREVFDYVASLKSESAVFTEKPSVRHAETKKTRDRGAWVIARLDEINNKRRTVWVAVKHLVEVGTSLEEINQLGKLAKASRPFLRPLIEIKDDLVNRYFFKAERNYRG